MRQIDYKGRFKTDYQKLKSGIYSQQIDGFFRTILEMLLNDRPLVQRPRIDREVERLSRSPHSARSGPDLSQTEWRDS
jgi:hypothetical protein